MISRSDRETEALTLVPIAALLSLALAQIVIGGADRLAVRAVGIEPLLGDSGNTSSNSFRNGV